MAPVSHPPRQTSADRALLPCAWCYNDHCSHLYQQDRWIAGKHILQDIIKERWDEKRAVKQTERQTRIENERKIKWGKKYTGWMSESLSDGSGRVHHGLVMRSEEKRPSQAWRGISRAREEMRWEQVSEGGLRILVGAVNWNTETVK